MRYGELYNLLVERIGGNLLNYVDFSYEGIRNIRGFRVHVYSFRIEEVEYEVYFAELLLRSVGVDRDGKVMSIGFSIKGANVTSEDSIKTRLYKVGDVMTYVVACFKDYIDKVAKNVYNGIIFETVKERNKIHKNQRSKLFNYFIRKYMKEFGVEVIEKIENERFELFLTTEFPERLKK